MVETRTEFVCKNTKLHIVSDHGKDVLLDHHKAFAGKPEDMMYKFSRTRVADGIKTFGAAGAK